MSIHTVLRVGLVVCSLVGVSTRAQEFREQFEKRVSEFTLDNGLKFIVVVGPEAPVFSRPEALRILVVGNPEKFDHPLSRYGSVREVDITIPGQPAQPATKRGLVGTLSSLDILEGKDQDALRRLGEVQALEEKPAQKLTSGMVERALLEARTQYKDRNSSEYRHAVGKLLRQRLDAMPFEVVENEIKGVKANLELLSEGLIIGVLRSVFDPVVQKTAALSDVLADQLPELKLALIELVPLKDSLVETLSSYLSAHAKEKPDIWAARAVRLEPGKSYAPVNIAVWDSGVDTAIFNVQLVRGQDSKPAVIAYDINFRKTTGELYPFPPDRASQIPELKQRVKG